MSNIIRYTIVFVILGLNIMYIPSPVGFVSGMFVGALLAFK